MQAGAAARASGYEAIAPEFQSTPLTLVGPNVDYFSKKTQHNVKFGMDTAQGVATVFGSKPVSGGIAIANAFTNRFVLSAKSHEVQAYQHGASEYGKRITQEYRMPNEAEASLKAGEVTGSTMFYQAPVQEYMTGRIERAYSMHLLTGRVSDPMISDEILRRNSSLSSLDKCTEDDFKKALQTMQEHQNLQRLHSASEPVGSNRTTQGVIDRPKADSAPPLLETTESAKDGPSMISSMGEGSESVEEMI